MKVMENKVIVEKGDTFTFSIMTGDEMVVQKTSQFWGDSYEFPIPEPFFRYMGPFGFASLFHKLNELSQPGVDRDEDIKEKP